MKIYMYKWKLFENPLGNSRVVILEIQLGTQDILNGLRNSSDILLEINFNLKRQDNVHLDEHECIENKIEVDDQIEKHMEYPSS